MVRFWTIENTLNEQGSAKAFACHDSHNRVYYIPRKLIDVVERKEPTTKYDVAHVLVEIPGWLIRKNGLPVFDLTELQVDR